MPPAPCLMTLTDLEEIKIMPKKNRHSKSKRSRTLRQHRNKMRRGEAPLAPEIELPGDWTEEIARAERELKLAHAELEIGT